MIGGDGESESGRVDYKNFKPRAGMEPQLSKMVHSVLRALPPPRLSKVVIRDRGGFYYFSVVFRLESRLYNSEANVEKTKATGLTRLWQLAVVTYLLKDLLRQIPEQIKQFGSADHEQIGRPGQKT
jgi:hypothetical protein